MFLFMQLAVALSQPVAGMPSVPATSPVASRSCAMEAANAPLAVMNWNDRSDRSMAAPSSTDSNKQHELWRSRDGLFYVDATVNGQDVRFLVDTGASMIVLTADDARRVGIQPDSSAYTRQADTAGGKSRMAGVTLANVRVGPTSASSVRAAVAREGLSVSLLGQNWLSQLESVMIKGDRMILR